MRAGGEGDDRGWDGWMASPTRWAWVWVNSRNWWWTGRPGVLRFMGSQRVGHDWETELNWTERHGKHHISLIGEYRCCDRDFLKRYNFMCLFMSVLSCLQVCIYSYAYFVSWASGENCVEKLFWTYWQKRFVFTCYIFIFEKLQLEEIGETEIIWGYHLLEA